MRSPGICGRPLACASAQKDGGGPPRKRATCCAIASSAAASSAALTAPPPSGRPASSRAAFSRMVANSGDAARPAVISRAASSMRGTSGRSLPALAMSCAAAEGAAAALPGKKASAAQAAIAATRDILLPAAMGMFALRHAVRPFRHEFQLIATRPRPSVTFRLHLPETYPRTRHKNSTPARSRHNMSPRLAPMAPVSSMGTAGGPRESNWAGGTWR